ncbi:MAG: glycoside hydrolase family 127 protein [Fimbriimonadales bacterium]
MFTAFALGVVTMKENREPIPYKAEARMPDMAVPASPADVRVEGYIGKRVANNEANRLREVDLEPLLAGFRHRPGSHPWIGEHIGKWMHAATLAWAYTGDPELKKRLEYAVRELIKTQEPDGYLGTYARDKRFGLFEGADWDVWSHKYCLIGLLTYYRFTGYQPALQACRKVGDLLIATFGAPESKVESQKSKVKSILSAGTHMGMAATSVLEPVVLLYRHTSDARYLDFAKYLVKAWDEPGGPRILSTLSSGGGVSKVANGKAYEMLSNLVGLCELARATGDRRYLVPALNAWADVVENQLYITGSASYGEVFHSDHDLPNGMGFNVGETCVTVTWMQLSEQLMRLTGQAKYGDEFERSLYNHLASAQRPDGKEWCYYTPLDGTKPYTNETCCCLSSGPRGMALVPEMSYLSVQRAARTTYLAVNLLESSSASMKIAGEEIGLVQSSEFPWNGKTILRLRMAKPATFGILVRSPGWSRPMRIKGATESNGWMEVAPREWNSGDTIEVSFHLGSTFVSGPSNRNQAALTWGPFVLAYASRPNSALGSPVKYSFTGSPAVKAEPSGLVFEANLQRGEEQRRATFVPFAEAGGDGSRYRIWMRAPGVPNPFADSLFLDASEARSAEGNVPGSITDADPASFVVTYDGRIQSEAWFSVHRKEPVQIRRIVFAHGQTFHDGGWFDASKEKPRAEIQEQQNGPWIPVGHFDGYPSTTAADPHGLRGGEAFTLTFDRAIRACGLRVIGRPASGDNPKQSFASCAELEAFTSK